MLAFFFLEVGITNVLPLGMLQFFRGFLLKYCNKG